MADEREQSGSSRRGWFVLAAAVIAGVLVAAAIVVTGGDGDDDDRTVSAAGEETAGFDEPFRFELRVVAEEPQPEHGLIVLGPTELTTHGQVADEEHWTVTEDASTGGGERRRIEDTVFQRTTPYEDLSVDMPEWTAAPAGASPVGRYVREVQHMELMVEEAPAPPSGSVQTVPGFETDRFNSSVGAHVLPLGYLLPVSDEPANLARLVRAATDLRPVDGSDESNRRWRGLLPPIEEIAGASSLFHFEPVEIELTFDEQDRPLSASFDIQHDDVTVEVDVVFADWGDPVTVQRPPEEEVDPTPWVTEEVLAVGPELLVLADALPEGWSLIGVDVLDPGHDCASFLSWYSSEEGMAEGAHLFVGAELQSCAEDPAPELAEGLGGEEQARYAEVGALRVEVSGTLDDEEMDDAIASLRPATVEEVLAAFAGWVRDPEPETVGMFVER